jgi:ATP-dependent Clp protease ATP-binding subunit ClpB
VYGARPLRRYIAHEVETRIARALLRDAVPDGATIRLDLGEVGELVVSHEVPTGAAA